MSSTEPIKSIEQPSSITSRKFLKAGVIQYLVLMISEAILAPRKAKSEIARSEVEDAGMCRSASEGSPRTVKSIAQTLLKFDRRGERSLRPEFRSTSRKQKTLFASKTSACVMLSDGGRMKARRFSRPGRRLKAPDERNCGQHL
jgi:hypothetical protein